MNWKIALGLLFLFLCSKCLYLQSMRLEQINYPETAFHSGFSPGQPEANLEYFRDWCQKHCERIKETARTLPENYYIEIRGKMDATETPKNREKLSIGRANSIKQLLSIYGIPENKLKVIPDPNPDQYLGKDKFDPENRTVRFRIQKRN